VVAVGVEVVEEIEVVVATFDADAKLTRVC
jgi:hypothetical protein